MFTLIVIIAVLSMLAIATVYVIECREYGREIERLDEAKRQVAGMAAKSRK